MTLQIFLILLLTPSGDKPLFEMRRSRILHSHDCFANCALKTVKTLAFTRKILDAAILSAEEAIAHFVLY